METVVFTGGGTGGHIYPGLAVAERLLKLRPCTIVWIGSSAPLDRQIVEKAGITFHSIPSGKLRRYFSIKNLYDIFKILAGYFAALRLLRRLKPSLVFSKGGFVSVPPCAAARSLGIPVFSHESDFSPGLATRINTRFAHTIFVAYEETARRLKTAPATRVLVSGNPVRSVFKEADPRRGRAFVGAAPEDRILLVLGGSQGARQVNDLLIDSLEELTKDWFIVHQTGALAENIPQARPRYKPYPFIHAELPDVLAAASLVCGRSGAGTIWEAAAAGKPLFLIPLSHASSRGDQSENAAWFAERGAACVLEGDEVCIERFRATLTRLARDSDELASMAQKASALGQRDAAISIAGEIVAVMDARAPL